MTHKVPSGNVDMSTLAHQTSNLAQNVNATAHKLARKGTAYLNGSFPGVPVNQTVHDTLASPSDASCWERSRDRVLRFFVDNQGFFTAVAIFLAVVFVLNICVLLVAFWGAVLGVGVLSPNDICEVPYLRSFVGCLTTETGATRCTS